MTTDILIRWTSFFNTTAEAAAALAGLVIVAISVNASRILEHQNLPARAAATIASLILVLALNIAGLMPGQTKTSFGWECAAMAFPVWLLQIWSARRAAASQGVYRRPALHVAVGFAIGQLQLVPMLAGSAFLIDDHGFGLYFLAAGAISTFIFSMLNTWILLIEILR